METIISALISAAAALIVSLYTVHVQQEKSMAILELKIETLTEKVEKHNSVIDRTYELEKQTSIQNEQIEDIRGRVETLERKGEAS